MRLRSILAIAFWLLGLMPALAASPLASLIGSRRVVVIVSAAGDPRAATQKRLLDAAEPALADRDVTVIDMTPEAASRLAPALAVAADADFELLLVGKDGGVKLRRHAVVPVSVLEQTIDAMPMRQQELRDRL